MKKSILQRFLTNNAINATSSILIGILNWLFAFIIIKTVSDESLSSYNAFIGLFMIVSFPATWIMLSTVQSGTNFYSQIKAALVTNIKWFAGLASIFVIILTVLGLIFRIPNILIIFMVISTFLGYISSYYKGLLQRDLRFIELSIFGISEVLLKIGFFYLLYSFTKTSFASSMQPNFVSGFTSVIPILAVVIQFFIITFVIFYVYRKGKFSSEKANISSVSKITLYFSLLYIVFTNVDVVMARAFLSVEESAQYIASLQFVKLIQFGTLALQNVLLPSIQKVKTVELKLKMMAIVSSAIVGVTILVLVVLSVFYDNISGLLELTGVSVTKVLLFTLFGSIFAISQMPLTLLLSEKSKSIASIAIVTLAIQLFLYLLIARSFTTFILVFGINSLFLFFSSMLALNREFDLPNLGKILTSNHE